MTRLLPISGRKMCKILEKLGFEKIRPDFIKAVEEAERRVAEGNVSTYSVDEFKKKFL